MNKIFLVFLVIFYSISAMVPSCHAALNLAKGKPYTVSPALNYPLSAPPTDTTALTDGSYSVGYFWTQKTTAGWQRAKTVEIMIDLEQDTSIERIIFNSARGNRADVNFPSHIAAFVGPDRDHLVYVGDLADDSENKPGAYEIRKFQLNNLAISGRYVLLEAIPNGVYLFCDEIEVIEGKSGQRKTGNYNLKSAHGFADKLIRLDRDKALLNKLADNLSNLEDKQTIKARLSEIKQQIAGLKMSNNPEVIETELLALRSSGLTNNIPSKTLHIQSINPWAHLSPISHVSDSSNTNLTVESPIGGYDSGAVLLTNLSASPMQVTIALEKTTSGSEVYLYQVPFIKTAALEQVADPLTPVIENFHLRPGESRMFFVTVLGKQPGKWINNIRIQNNGKVTLLPITIQVAKVEMPTKLSLNTINWGYLNFNLIRDRQQAAIADLKAHHINVVVVPPAFLPNVNHLDFSRMESYLKKHRGTDKLLLFMNLRTDNRLMMGSTYPFLGELWKTAVKKWYDGAKQAAVRAGFKSDQIYLYPFDEMNDKEMDQFISFSKWVRSEIPGVKLYATLDDKNSERVLPYLDIAQIHRKITLNKEISSTKTDLWMYDTKAPAKSLSPYSYYRMMAWEAFIRGYKGIGFWAYADTGWGDNPGTAWDDFDGKNPDYAVIYEGENNTIISSRRWEAWRMGIEDYELLTMYARKNGEAAAKALAKGVLDKPDDTTRADLVRRQILEELSK